MPDDHGRGRGPAHDTLRRGRAPTGRLVTPPAFDLNGRVALVTGAGSPSGIGFAAARLLAQMGASVEVAATTARSEERAGELVAEGHHAHGSWADLTDATAAQDLVDAARERWGRLDIVVNNAGMTSVASPGSAEAGDAIALSPESWRASIARNLDSAFYVSRAALPLMRDAGWGRIVMVASVTGPVMAMQGETGYAAAKAGMVGLTRSLAVDFAASGVTVNAVAPGWIATGSQTDHEREQGLRTPMGRSATADEVASAIAWLCTPGASYTTGQCLVVDGGNSIA
ncbi:MAG: SDR family NAD(P)-dependent oxidoreductase, partial [Candidatus Nanopelagicales bacterium]